jgi:hypothetical protein
VRRDAKGKCWLSTKANVFLAGSLTPCEESAHFNNVFLL